MKTGIFYLLDNLPVLRGLDTDSVDLIATDPPFNSKREYVGTDKAQHFGDMWRWDEVTTAWAELTEPDFLEVSPVQREAIRAVIEAALIIEGGRIEDDGSVCTGQVKNSMAAFLTFMAPRLVHMRRVLKPTGSLFLHCDSAANSYLRLLLDAVFGRSAFRNGISWCYTGPANTRKHFPRKHDTIYFYAMPEATLRRDAVRVPYKTRMVSRGSLGGGTNADRQIFKEGHDVSRLDDLFEKGKVPEDWWGDIVPCTRQHPERSGFPTQKPTDLYVRMILASTDEGDVVFDPFAGCATTLVAAHKKKRQWIGCDVNPNRKDVVESQMRRLAGVHSITTRESPPYRSDMPRMSKKELTTHLWLQQGRQCDNSYCDSRVRLDKNGDDWGDGEIRRSEATLDHKIPKSRQGGEVRVFCFPCNTRKGTKSDTEFRANEAQHKVKTSDRNVRRRRSRR